MEFPETLWSVLKKRSAAERTKHILEEYSAPITAFMRAHGVSAKDSEDLSQEVFLRITKPEFLEKADEKVGKFRTLVLTVTRNVIIDFVRKKKAGRHKTIHIESIRRGTTSVFEVEAPAEDLEEFRQMWVSNLIAMGMKELARRDKKKHDALEMAVFRRMKYSEISAALSGTETDVTNWIHHAKRQLKEIVRECIRAYCSSEDELASEIKGLKFDI